MSDNLIEMVNFREESRYIKEELQQSIKKVIDSGRYILGEEVQKFEQEFAKYIGTKYAIGVNSGTDALLTSLMALSIKPGDEVITVSHTTTPTVLPIITLGALPVFIDICSDTYTMDSSQIEKKITKKTKAIIPVHLYGNPVDMEPIIEIAKKYGIHVIEDACQAHGAEYKGKKVGTFGVLSAFSFYPTKNLGGYGDGGIILTNDYRLQEKAVMLRQYGWKKRYSSRIPGINSRLDEIQAAILRVKLKYLDEWNTRRIKTAEHYKKLLKNKNIILPQQQKYSKHVYHQFVIRHKKRDQLQKYLLDNDIQTQIHYPIPVHKQKTFTDLGIKTRMPVTEKICTEILSLPIHPWLKEEEIKHIAKFVINYSGKIQC